MAEADDDLFAKMIDRLADFDPNATVVDMADYRRVSLIGEVVTAEVREGTEFGKMMLPGIEHYLTDPVARAYIGLPPRKHPRRQ